MKILNGLKALFLAVVMGQIVGCASVETATKKVIANSHGLTKSGEMIGLVTNDPSGIVNTASVCEVIKNSDARCLSESEYELREVTGRFGYFDGAQATFVFIPKAAGNIKWGSVGCDDCTYVKVKLRRDGFAEFIEIADKGGEGKCHWEGGNKMGGTVCPAYNWDYRKDMVLENIVRK